MQWCSLSASFLLGCVIQDSLPRVPMMVWVFLHKLAINVTPLIGQRDLQTLCGESLPR